MATSPNYSWPEPDNTDLVKNGALAIRTMGNAIDTTMATMTPKSTYTAKGSIAAATGASTPANLSVGNNGETLVADSSTSTGLRYQAPIQQNPVINSAMQVWQRGTSFAVSGSAAYTADRWQAISAAYTAGLTVSRQATSDTTNLPFIQYCARVQRDSGNTSTAARNLQQNFESVNSIPFAGKTVTLSFYARAGANYSSASSSLGVQWVWGTGTDQNNYLTGLTGSTNVSATTSVTLTTTWQRFSITGTIGSTATQIALNYYFSGVGTAGANDYFEVTGVQMEVGSVATPFHTYAATIQGELSAAQRYYYRANWDAKAAYPVFAQGGGYSTTNARLTMPFPVSMRVQPTAIESSALANLRVQSFSDGTSIAPSSISLDGNFTTTTMGFINAGVASGLTANALYYLRGEGSTAYYIGWSAEL